MIASLFLALAALICCAAVGRCHAVEEEDGDERLLEDLALASSVSPAAPGAVTVLAVSDDDAMVEFASRTHRVGAHGGILVFLQATGDLDKEVALDCGGSYYAPELPSVLMDSVVEAAALCNARERGGGARLTHVTTGPSGATPTGADGDVGKILMLHSVVREENLTSLVDSSRRRRCDVASLHQCSYDPNGITNTTLRAVYDLWDPMFFENRHGDHVGIMHDIVNIIAKRFDITLGWYPNPEPYVWGTDTGDGRFDGMIGQVQRGEFDLSAAGFESNPGRAAVVDFALSTCRLVSTLFVQAPSRSKVSWQNYLKEFDLYCWCAIVGTSLCLVLSLHCMMAWRRYSSQISVPFAVALRALIGKGSGFRASSFPTRSLHLTLLLFATVIFASYRSAMNAFLAVLIPVQDVHNLEDVLELTSGLTIWTDTSYEGYFRRAPKDTVEGALYQKFLADKQAQIQSYKRGLDNVVDRNYVLLAEQSVINKERAYACLVDRVPGYLFLRMSFVIPFTPGSKYARPFSEEILQMKNSGVMDRLLDKYLVRKGLNDGCNKGAGGLGFSNVFTPFLLLALGVGTGVGFVLIEKTVRLCRECC